jgi:hypothetical protein
MSRWLVEIILQNIQILIGARVLITGTSSRILGGTKTFNHDQKNKWTEGGS